MTPGLALAPGPLGGGILVPHFLLSIEGVPVPPRIVSTIRAVSVTQIANEPAGFELEVHDPKLLLIEAADGLFAEGRRLEIALGYVGNSVPIIEGEITAIDVSLDDSGGLALRVEGFDGLHTGTRGRTSRIFAEGKSDSAIVREIAAELLPAVVVDQTPPRSGVRAQREETTLGFLQRLAQENSFQLWAEGRTLFFMRRRLGPPVTFARGQNLIAFSTRLSTAGQAGEIEILGWDCARQREIKASATANRSADYLRTLSATGLAQVVGKVLGGGGTSKRVIDAQGRVTSIGEAQTLADAEMTEQRRNLLTANGSVIGDPQVRVGSIVALLGMGRFSLAPYVVEQVTHQINASGYRTTFAMRQYL
jgi:hypothetical protein